MFEVKQFLAFIQVTVLLYPPHGVHTTGINKIDNSCTPGLCSSHNWGVCKPKHAEAKTRLGSGSSVWNSLSRCRFLHLLQHTWRVRVTPMFITIIDSCVQAGGGHRVVVAHLLGGLQIPWWLGSDHPMDWWLGLHQPPWSFGFDSQTRWTRENRLTPCVKVQGSSWVSAPPWVDSRSWWLGSDPLMGWWLGLAPATLEFWVWF